MHEEVEEGHKVDQLGGLKFGNNMRDELRHKFRYCRSDGVDELRKRKAGLGTMSPDRCTDDFAHRVADDTLRLHPVKGLKKCFCHLLEGGLIWQCLQLSIANLREPLGEVAESHQVVVNLKHRNQVPGCLSIPMKTGFDTGHERTSDSLKQWYLLSGIALGEVSEVPRSFEQVELVLEVGLSSCRLEKQIIFRSFCLR